MFFKWASHTHTHTQIMFYQFVFPFYPFSSFFLQLSGFYFMWYFIMLTLKIVKKKWKKWKKKQRGNI